MTPRIKAAAQRLGFELVGIAPAVTPTGLHEFLDWLEQESLVCCPDPEERLVMRIERTSQRTLRTDDLT